MLFLCPNIHQFFDANIAWLILDHKLWPICLPSGDSKSMWDASSVYKAKKLLPYLFMLNDFTMCIYSVAQISIMQMEKMPQFSNCSSASFTCPRPDFTVVNDFFQLLYLGYLVTWELVHSPTQQERTVITSEQFGLISLTELRPWNQLIDASPSGLGGGFLQL